MDEHKIWYGAAFLIACVMLAKCHDCPNPKEKIVYKEAEECKKPEANPEVAWSAYNDPSWYHGYYWNDSEKQCHFAHLRGGSRFDRNSWMCSSTSIDFSSTYNTKAVTCKGLESEGKTGSVLFSLHHDEHKPRYAFYLKKLADPSSVLDYWAKETRFYFWKTQADCMVDGPSKFANRIKTDQ